MTPVPSETKILFPTCINKVGTKVAAYVSNDQILFPLQSQIPMFVIIPMIIWFPPSSVAQHTILRGVVHPVNIYNEYRSRIVTLFSSSVIAHSCSLSDTNTLRSLLSIVWLLRTFLVFVSHSFTDLSSETVIMRSFLGSTTAMLRIKDVCPSSSPIFLN